MHLVGKQRQTSWVSIWRRTMDTYSCLSPVIAGRCLHSSFPHLFHHRRSGRKSFLQRHWMKEGVFKRDSHWLGCESYETLPWWSGWSLVAMRSLFRARRYHSALNVSSQTPKLLFFILQGWRGRGEGRGVRRKASPVLTGSFLHSVWKVGKLILSPGLCKHSHHWGPLTHVLHCGGVPSIP